MYCLQEKCISWESSGEIAILSGSIPEPRETQCPSALSGCSCWLSGASQSSEARSGLIGHLQIHMLQCGSETQVLTCQTVSRETHVRLRSISQTGKSFAMSPTAFPSFVSRAVLL